MIDSELAQRISNPVFRKSLALAREAVDKVWPEDVDRVITYYTSHGPKHLARVETLAGQVLEANRGRALSETELYLLLSGIYFHDLGMQCDPRRHSGVVDLAIRQFGADPRLRDFTYPIGPLTPTEQKRIRKNHHLLSVAWVCWAREHPDAMMAAAARGIPEDLVEDVVDICRYHTSLPIRDCTRWAKGDPEARKRLVAAVLRLADELDISSSRVSHVDVVRQFAVDPKNEIYWWLHGATDLQIQPDSLILLTFKLNPADAGLAEIVKQIVVDRFQEKNQDCMSVLAEDLISVAASQESGIREDPEAPQLPQSMVAELHALMEGAGTQDAKPLPARELPPELLRQLLLDLDACVDGSDYMGLLGLLDGLEAGTLRRRGGTESVRVQTLNELQEKTAAAVTSALDALLGHVLPRCLYEDSPEHEDGRFTAYLYRERLEDWLQSHPIQLAPCRSVLLRLLSTAILSSHREQACWTIEKVGVRTAQIIESLWQVANGEDDGAADAALACIIHLGVTPETRGPLVHALIRTLASGRVSVPLWGALAALEDPQTVNAVRASWLLEGVEAPPSQALYGLRVLAKIAAAHPSRRDLQEKTWNIVGGYIDRFSEHLDAHLLLDSNIAASFDIEDVVYRLVALLDSETQEQEVSRRRRDLLCRRLLECVRPSQVTAWRQVGDDNASAVRALLEDTRVDSGVALSSQTEIGLLKEVAWQVLLSARTSELLSVEYFETSVLGEASPYLHGEAIEWLACFRFETLPPSAVRLVTEEYDEQRDTFPPQHPDRSGAIRLLRSAATWEAFEGLLRFGYTYMGNVLQESVAAIATVAGHLSAVDEDRVLRTLTEMALHGKVPRWRTGAIGALYLLRNSDSFTGPDSDALISLARDETLSPHDRSQAIQLLGFTPPEGLSSSFREQLMEWAQTASNEQVRWAALESLARTGELEKRTDLLSASTGIEQSGGHLRLADPTQLSNTAALVICLLYQRDGITFAPVMAAVLESCETEALFTAVHAIHVVHRNDSQRPAPEAVRGALLARLSHGGSLWVSIQNLLEVVAEVLPGDLVQVGRSAEGERWREEDFRALADLLGRSQYTSDEPKQDAINHLLELTRSRYFSVRRSAYRSIQLLHRELHQRLCGTWAMSADPALRRRAAEASVYLDPAAEDGDDWPPFLRPLSWDSEPTVREAARRAREDWLHS